MRRPLNEQDKEERIEHCLKSVNEVLMEHNGKTVNRRILRDGLIQKNCKYVDALLGYLSLKEFLIPLTGENRIYQGLPAYFVMNPIVPREIVESVLKRLWRNNEVLKKNYISDLTPSEEIEAAIKLLKDAGYKVMKPIVDYAEV